MSIFDDLSKSFRNITNAAGDKSKEISTTTRMNANIRTEEKNIDESYRQLGEYIYSHRADPASLDYSAYLLQIDESFKKIREYQAVIDEIAANKEKAAQEAAEEEEAQEIHEIFCPSCKSLVPADANFCPVCGYDLSLIPGAAAKEAAQKAAEAAAAKKAAAEAQAETEAAKAEAQAEAEAAQAEAQAAQAEAQAEAEAAQAEAEAAKAEAQAEAQAAQAEAQAVAQEAAQAAAAAQAEADAANQASSEESNAGF